MTTPGTERRNFSNSGVSRGSPAAAKTTANEPHKLVAYRIHIDRVTGRRAVRDRA